jgi:hypothetical protein
VQVSEQVLEEVEEQITQVQQAVLLLDLQVETVEQEKMLLQFLEQLLKLFILRYQHLEDQQAHLQEEVQEDQINHLVHQQQELVVEVMQEVTQIQQLKVDLKTLVEVLVVQEEVQQELLVKVEQMVEKE